MPRLILISAIILFSILGCVGVVKKIAAKKHSTETVSEKKPGSVPSETPVVSLPAKNNSSPLTAQQKERTLPPVASSGNNELPRPSISAKDDFPNIDRIFQLFTLGGTKFPIVETITYTSSASWLKGRPAWLVDYASHYSTSRHFIARSLNGKPDYFSQKISEGSRFNVFRTDKRIQFYLLVDVSRCKMGFYYVDLDTNERVLLKTYSVGLGRPDSHSVSGTLTPLGRYTLGSHVAVYTPGVEGYYHDQKVEMMRVFGTRWIPFDQEVERATASAKGYGLQGAPFTFDAKSEQYIENKICIGAYDSDGCIRLASEDMEELFSVVISKPTFIEIVKDFHEAKLPGKEVATPSR
jgi:L,D-transpeptidase catalytic domain